MRRNRRKPVAPRKRKKRSYLVLIERGPKNYGASVPDLPGCVAVGRTRAETLRLIRGALRMHLEAMERDGDPIPEPTSIGDVVEV